MILNDSRGKDYFFQEKLFILREEDPSAAAFAQVFGRDDSETLPLVRAGESPGVLGGDQIPLDPSNSSDWSWSLPFLVPFRFLI